MKHIIWIPSYPKSGNTWVRLILTCLFFTKDGIFNDFTELKHIDKFDSFKFFKFIKNESLNDYKKIFNNKNFNEDSFLTYFKYNIKAQKRIYSKGKIIFFKTHNARAKINNNFYTDEQTTLGFIYIIRDPRDIVVSYSNYLSEDINKTIDLLIDTKIHGNEKNLEIFPEVLLNWKDHYLSWSKFDKVPSLFLRYEDLLENQHKQITNIINFLFKNYNIEINNLEKKIENTISSISFKKLQNLETIKKFEENLNKHNKPFFRKGETGNWKNILNQKQINKIQNAFHDVMVKNNYELY